jgi:uncharacterized protein YjiS (DUF1127 family)
MAATTVTIGNPRPGMIAGLVAWWRNMRAARGQLGELQDCAGELGPIARDLGVTRSELYTIAAKRPDAADQLALRLAALHLDRAAILRTDPLVMRDLERVCTLCGEKHRCRRDWLRHPDGAAWRAYCPNAMTLAALEEGQAADKVCAGSMSRAPA